MTAFGGLGIDVSARYGEIKVQRVATNTWADGRLRAGDRIREVDDIKVRDADPVRALLRLSSYNAKKQPVRIRIIRDDGTDFGEHLTFVTPPPSPVISRL